MDWEKLLNDFFAGDSLEALVRDAGGALGCPMLVVDNTFHILASFVPHGFYDSVFDAAIKRGEITYEAISALNWDLAPAPLAGVFQPVQDSAYERRFSRLVSGGVRMGYLICVDWRGELRETPDGDFRRVEAVLAKQLVCRRGPDRSYSTTAQEVLTQLLDGKFSGPSAFYAQMGTTYLAGYNASRLALIDLGLYHSSNFRDDTLKNELLQEFPASRPFLYQDRVVLLLNDSHSPDRLDGLSERYRLRTVISERFDELYNLPAVYSAVTEVMEYRLPGAEGAFSAYMCQYRYLMALRRLAGAHELAEPAVRTMHRHDAEHGTQLCLTLYTYLICHHSVQLTCERLYAHKNTVMYRLHRIKDDFGVNLDDVENTAPLLLSAALALLDDRMDRLFVRERRVGNA